MIHAEDFSYYDTGQKSIAKRKLPCLGIRGGTWSPSADYLYGPENFNEETAHTFCDMNTNNDEGHSYTTFNNGMQFFVISYIFQFDYSIPIFTHL